MRPEPLSRVLTLIRQEMGGITQEQFAGELGITVSTMNRWENGHSKPCTALTRRALINYVNSKLPAWELCHTPAGWTFDRRT